MALADALIGGGQSIQQLLLERELEKAGVSPIQLAQAKLAQQNQEMGLKQQDLELRRQTLASNQARQAALDQEAAQQKASSEANALGDQLPPGAFLDVSDPAVSMMQKGGRGGLLTRSSRPMTADEFQGPLQEGQGVPDTQTSPGFLKTASQKQIDTNTDNARQQAALDSAEADRAAARAQSAQQHNDTLGLQRSNADALNAYRQAMLAQGNERLKQGQERIDKPAAASKLGQRDNDTVVTVHQMMPLVGQAITELQKRVANQRPPEGGIVGALKQIPNRLERGAQSAAYNLGLGQPSDISNQIQLESLMQVMGSTPYLRGSRNYQLIKQIQQHLADPTATDAANLERLKQLQQILPGIEQAIYDVNNQGVIPHEHGANYTGQTGPTAEDLIKKYGGR